MRMAVNREPGTLLMQCAERVLPMRKAGRSGTTFTAGLKSLRNVTMTIVAGGGCYRLPINVTNNDSTNFHHQQHKRENVQQGHSDILDHLQEAYSSRSRRYSNMEVQKLTGTSHDHRPPFGPHNVIQLQTYDLTNAGSIDNEGFTVRELVRSDLRVQLTSFTKVEKEVLS